MPAITAPGIGSGLDVEGIVNQLVAVEGQPATQRLDLREGDLQARLSAFGSLKSAVSTFQDSLASLSDVSGFNSKSAQSGDEKVATVSASSAAIPGNYDIDVTQLADAHTLVTDSSLAGAQFTSLTDTVGTGSLTFRLGTTTYDPLTDTYTPPFVPDPNNVAAAVTITDGSLSGIRDAVNAADIGVSASIIFDGTNYRLAFASDKTGAGNSLEITVLDDDANNTDASGLSLLSFNENSNHLLQTQAAQDALVKISGIDITSATNTLNEALEGQTIDLLGTGKTALNVVKDTAVVSANITEFVEQYNALVDTVKDLSSFDVDTQQAGALNGDAVLRSVNSQLRAILTSSVKGAADGFSVLSSIGITRSSTDGKLVIDTTKLNDAIRDNPDDVTALFASFGKPSDSLIDFTSSSNATIGGKYAVNITQLATQGQLVGSAAANLVITSGVNDALNIKVDGTDAGITLSAGTYTEEALVTELQSKINANTALKDNGITTSVSVAGGVLTVVSQRYGSVSKAAVTGGNAADGLFGVSPVATDGLDVVGSIGGLAATGSGQTLTGTGAATDLVISVQGGVLGDRGFVNVSNGYAGQLDELLTGILQSDGILQATTEGINDRIKDISDDRDALARRLDAFETRTRRQFTVLDALTSQLQATSNFLSQQLASLPTIGANNSNG